METSNSEAVLEVSENRKNYLEGDCPSVSVEVALATKMTLVDVRTAEEFAEGRIPDAQSLPLFDDLERAEIGTLYKQIGKDAAIVHGKQIMEPRAESFVASFQHLKSEPFAIYCARGGMRSASVVRLLQNHGFQVQQMRGGYKMYRHHVLEQLEKPSPYLIVLHGQTGVGKTLLLNLLPDHLDLEGLAQHRSSLFGAIHKIPRTQKNFEALLLSQLSQLPTDRRIFIEGESRKVGQVFIPKSIAEGMKKGKLVLLTASIETRIQRIIEEYQVSSEKSYLEIEKILNSLRVALGHLKVNQMLEWLKQEKIEEIVEMLLIDYYDPRYLHAMRDHEYDLELSAEDLDFAANQLIDFRDKLH